MSVAEGAPPVDSAADATPPARLGWFERLDGRLAAASDWLSPILVKEARQAVKSRHFALTFSAVLIAAWAWSMLGTAWTGLDGGRLLAAGSEVFAGYVAILAFPLLVVVPFATFRSLSAEREDRTFELLQITALTPSQAVIGKIISALLQMMVYLSAVAPCMAFTYLLRGITVFEIGLLLVYLIGAGLGLTAICAFFATLSTERHWNVALSVVAIAGLFFSFFLFLGLTFQGLEELVIIAGDDEFWIVNSAIVTAFVAYFLFFVVAAASRITFPSDNRSTRLRYVMHLHPLLLLGWLAAIRFQEFGPGDVTPLILVAAMLIAIHWAAMGAVLIGERPEMSSRVKRELPLSLAGRMFHSWFNPGPSTGFLLVVANLSATMLLFVLAVAAENLLVNGVWSLQGAGAFGAPTYDLVLTFALCAFSYVVFYLGLGLICTRVLRRLSPSASGALGFVVVVTLIAAGAGFPMVLHNFFWPRQFEEYLLIELPNPFWTLASFLPNQSMYATYAVEFTVMPAAAALLIVLLNLYGVARELGYIRQPKPQRVVEDDAARNRRPRPKRNPWDEGEEAPPGPTTAAES